MTATAPPTSRVAITARAWGITHEQIADILTQRLPDRGPYTRAQVGDRIRGRVEWRAAELNALAREWGTTVEDLNRPESDGPVQINTGRETA